MALTSLLPRVPLSQGHSVLTGFSSTPFGEVGSPLSAGAGWGTGGDGQLRPVTLSRPTLSRPGLQLEAQIHAEIMRGLGLGPTGGRQEGNLEHPVRVRGPWEPGELSGVGGPAATGLLLRPASGLPRPRQGPAARRSAAVPPHPPTPALHRPHLLLQPHHSSASQHRPHGNRGGGGGSCCIWPLTGFH